DIRAAQVAVDRDAVLPAVRVGISGDPLAAELNRGRSLRVVGEAYRALVHLFARLGSGGGADLQRALEGADGFGLLALRILAFAEHGEGFRIIRVRRDRLLECRGSLRELLVVVERRSEALVEA